MVNVHDTLLTVEQAAEFAGVVVATIRYWHRTGRLKESARLIDKTTRRHRVYFTRGAVEMVCRATCPLCGSTFRRSNLSQIYCTDACRKTAHRVSRVKGKEHRSTQ